MARVTPIDQPELVAICERLEREPELAIDTETTGFGTYQNDVLRGISIASATEQWYIPVSHPGGPNFDPAPLRTLLENTDALVDMHNSPFDLGVLEQAGVGTVRDGHLYDTQVADWLIDENQDHRLKEGLGARMHGYEWAMEEKNELKRIREEEGRDFPTFTVADIDEYAAQDARLTFDAAVRQRPLMRKMEDSPLPDFDREIRFQRRLVQLMRIGIRVDEERAERQYQEALGRRDELREAFASIQLPGTKLRGRGKNRHEVPKYELGVNMNSTDQLGLLIYDVWGLEPYLRTPGGKRSTSKEALEPHAEVDERIAAVLEHRRADKACSGFYEPLARFAGRDGRVHPSIQSARTVTGRLTCSSPNMQTIPRADVLAGIRNCIIPADGDELWEYDLDSAELRIIGAVTKEPALFSAMREGRDLHSETAASVFGANFTGVQRRFAKNMNYGYPYGIGVEKLARYIAAGPPRRPMSRQILGEAARMKKRYARNYARMTAFMDALADQAKLRGYLPLSKPGRYRHFRTMRHDADGPPKYYTALNALVQGTVAELMKDVMLEFDGNVDGRMVLQVHDSLVVEVAPGDGPRVGEQIQAIVDQCNVFPEMPMPISAKEWGT